MTRKHLIATIITVSISCAPKNPNPAHTESSNTTTTAPSTPSVDDVLDRYIQVTGGEESYLAYENSRMEGVIEIAAQGLRGEVFVYHEAPNRRRLVMTIPGIGEVIRVYNGEHGWEINPLLGPRVLTEDELSTEKIDSTFNGALYMDSLYPDREMVGANTFNGVNSWEIRLTTDTGNSRNVHYDQQTGLMLGMLATVPTDMGDMPIEARLEDYQDIGGVLMPLRSVQIMGPMEIVTHFSSVEWNVEQEVDWSVPEDIRALLP